jgi:hypothetical protein
MAEFLAGDPKFCCTGDGPCSQPRAPAIDWRLKPPSRGSRETIEGVGVVEVTGY